MGQRKEDESIEVAGIEMIYDLCVPMAHDKDAFTLRVLYLGVLHYGKVRQIVASVPVAKIVGVKTYQ
jgi:hypothetical protein